MRNDFLAVAFIVGALVACGDERERATAGPATSKQSREFRLPSYELGKLPGDRWALPETLREISGLAATPDGRLLGHNDEEGIIYEIDLHGGGLVKTFQIGQEIVLADFEGITVAEGSIFLVASDGELYETREGRDGEKVAYKTYTSGVGADCSIEGLAYEPSDRVLLLACKKTYREELEDSIAIFRWSLATKRVADPPFLLAPKKEIRRFLPESRLHPSGIARHPASGTYFVIAARERAIIEITPEGRVVGAVALLRNSHRQSEGIAFVGGLDLVIADEGGDGYPVLTRYRLQDP